MIVDAAFDQDRRVQLKDMESGTQRPVTIESLMEDPFQTLE